MSWEGAGSPNGFVRLEISDSGSGITTEQKIKLFDPFFTTKPGGHGLGLAVVQGIVQAHHGAINVLSTPGSGTTFEVWLPCAGEHAESRSSTRYPAQEFSAASGTVLFVEDEEPLRVGTAASLRKLGLSVLTAANGPAAVEIFRAHAGEIAVVLLHLTLPGISGHEVLRRMRAIKPEVRVILTSAYGPEIASDSTREQSARFLQKPYRIANVKRELEESLSEGPRTNFARHQPSPS